nr:bacteriocin immunity protein [Streptomyces sp. NA02536]
MVDVRDLTRDQLVELVRKIMVTNGTEEEDDKLVEILEANVPHPRVLNLIYHPDAEGFTDDLTAEEVVDTALAHTPFAL